MTEKKQPSIAEILAACRKADGAGRETAPETGDATAEQASPAAVAKPATPSAAATDSGAPRTNKPTGKMSVAEIIAAAKSADAGGSAAAPAALAATTAAAPSKKPAQMSVAEMMAAARAEKKAAPAAAAAPKPPKSVADKASPKTPVATKPAAAAMDTASILAAARKPNQPGPMTKAEAAKLAKTAPQKSPTPTMPPRPAYLTTKPVKPTDKDATDRRGFFSVLFGSFLAVGFTCVGLVSAIWGLGLARFMFPNILTEPPSKFKVGFPSDFPQGTVATKFKAQFGVWIVNTEYEGQEQIVALKSVCTHLGCTPNWLDGEQKFKCPCHGSGFYIDGINFEGPAPRPLERYAIRIADDGQLEVDKSKKFQQELGQWTNPTCYVQV